MKRVSLHVAAALGLTSAAVVLFSIGTAYAKDVPSGRDGNPGNHYGEISNPGHHYGQFKHQPVPTPTPPPQPQPAPQPATHPSSGGGGTHSVTAVSTPAAPAPNPSSVSDVPIVVPPITRPADNVVVANPDTSDALWWLVLVILPLLLAVWAIAFGRIVRRLTRRRGTAAAVLSGAPAV